MAKDYSPVGASLSSSKSAAGLDGDEVFDDRVSVRRADNGGFILSVSYRKERKGSKTGENYPSYCPDKELVFDTFEQMSAQIQKLFGA